MQTLRALRVFVSHAWADKAEPDRPVLKRLELAYDDSSIARLWIDRSEMQAGAVIRESVREALAKSDVALVLASDHAATSPSVREEVRWIVERGVYCVPVLIQPGFDFEAHEAFEPLRGTLRLDLSVQPEVGMTRLKHLLTEHWIKLHEHAPLAPQEREVFESVRRTHASMSAAQGDMQDYTYRAEQGSTGMGSQLYSSSNLRKIKAMVAAAAVPDEALLRYLDALEEVTTRYPHDRSAEDLLAAHSWIVALLCDPGAESDMVQGFASASAKSLEASRPKVASMLRQVEAAVRDEAATPRLRTHLARAAESNGAPLTDAQLDEVAAVAVRFVVDTPLLVLELWKAAETQGCLDACRAVLGQLCDYWQKADDAVPDDRGVYGLLDDAWLSMSLLEKLNRQTKAATGAALVTCDFGGNARIARLFESPVRARLESMVSGGSFEVPWKSIGKILGTVALVGVGVGVLGKLLAGAGSLLDGRTSPRANRAPPPPEVTEEDVADLLARAGASKEVGAPRADRDPRLAGHWRRTEAMSSGGFSMTTDHHMVLQSDGRFACHYHSVGSTGETRSEKRRGVWESRGGALVLAYDDGREDARAYSIHEGQLFFPESTTKRLWERV